jgi:acetyl esterase/lipase
MSETLTRSSLAGHAGTEAARTTGTRARSWFAVGTAIFVILLHVVGFTPSAVEPAVRNGPPSATVLAHLFLGAAWLLLFMAQTVLVATRRTATHRRLGAVAPFLTLAMVILVVATVTDEARRGYDFSGDISRGAFAPGMALTAKERVEAATVGMLAPLLATLNFVFLVGVGLWYRRRPEIHSRLMLLSLLSLALVPLIHLGGHTIGHWPSLHGAITTAIPLLGNALLFVVAGRDWIVQRRIHPISLWVPIALIVEFGLVVGLVTPTSGWRRAAEWLAGSAQLEVGAVQSGKNPSMEHAALMTPQEFLALPRLEPDHQLAYGDDPTQIGHLRIPSGTGPFPIVVLIHGGCWREPFASLHSIGPIGDTLKIEGIATWNIEYRRLPQPGSGWPGTYLDIARGVDHLRTLAPTYRLDLNRLVIVGHSAGGHLAMWAASRSRIEPGSDLYVANPIKPSGVINLAGTMDMSVNIENMAKACDAPVVHDMLGGTPAEVPYRYAESSVFRLLPIGVSQVLMWGEHEEFVPHVLAQTHIDAATQEGDPAVLLVAPGVGHFEIATTLEPSWPILRGAIISLLDGRLPAP